jgi:hypothetical protein
VRIGIARLAAAIGAATVTAALVVAGGASAGAAPACTTTYQVNQWNTGFVAQVAVSNAGAALPNWTLTWTFAGDQRVTSGWNATVAQSGKTVSAAGTGALPTGGSAQFGFQATYSGTNATPADFALNGVRCNDDVVPPTTTTTTTTTPIPPVDCPSGGVCDGFEDQTGATPSGRWTVGSPNCSGTGTASVDAGVAHSGSKSVRVDGRAGYCNHVFVATSLASLPAGQPVFGRFWVRHTTALPEAHVTFLAMRDSADGGKDLRMGGQNRALQWNRESDDATLPEQSPAGVAQSTPLPLNTWTCVEFRVDGANGHLSTWVNGTAVTGLQVDGVPTADVDGQWLRRAGWRPAVTDLRLGWESYGNGDDTLWFDDVALATSRPGCSG